jgi:hypothetical protein
MALESWEKSVKFAPTSPEAESWARQGLRTEGRTQGSAARRGRRGGAAGTRPAIPLWIVGRLRFSC